MKTKKDVFGVVGIILFILAVIIIGDYGNFVSSEDVDVGVSYEELIADIDDSLMKTYSNNDKLNSLDKNLKIAQDDLEATLDDYTFLGEEIKKITWDIEKIKEEIDKTKDDSNKLREKRIKLQNQIENEGDDGEARMGEEIRIWLFYLSLFISINLFIWFEMSTYYRERNYRYRRF